MPKIYDLVTAANLSGYYEATKPDSTNIGDQLFPARKQLGLRLDFIKGANKRAVVLKASAFDTQASLRDRMSIKLSSENMPYFDEGMLVKEEDRQQLNMIAQTNNQELLDAVVDNIYDDEATLISAAKARTHAMRMQVLATGKLQINSNGVRREFDYGVPEENQGQAATDWSATEADPIADIDTAIEAMAEQGISPAGMVMNSKTYGYLRKSASTAKRITGVKANQPTRNQVIEYLRDEYGLYATLVDDTFIDDAGEVRKYFPDGRVTFVPNQPVGNTVFGTTPAESDLQNGNTPGVSVAVVETGVAVVTEQKVNPVNVETRVSMINLPSFEGANMVYLLQTDLAAEEPVDPGTGE
ncbi:hypothetical protein BKP56_07165 [Marinilactibacillus sp. 15R]|uniref:major capsid protein n=1 Tax=Marinilactibacillus sp. 15R TaxID=1911586 RepID=UPI00090C8B70|nr:major capsid protein [Marinilactibacillus sp. 15R]API89046.1 hypothetical protein BKP56_07165 [Marinilactibacillus sp. 15R]